MIRRKVYFKKNNNLFGNIGIFVDEKINGKMKQLATIGVAKSEEDIESLVSQGLEWIGEEVPTVSTTRFR